MTLWTLLNTPLRLRRRWLFRPRLDPETDGRRIAKWLLVLLAISLPALLSVQIVRAHLDKRPRCQHVDARSGLGVDSAGKLCRKRQA